MNATHTLFPTLAEQGFDTDELELGSQSLPKRARFSTKSGDVEGNDFQFSEHPNWPDAN